MGQHWYVKCLAMGIYGSYMVEVSVSQQDFLYCPVMFFDNTEQVNGLGSRINNKAVIAFPVDAKKAVDLEIATYGYTH